MSFRRSLSAAVVAAGTLVLASEAGAQPIVPRDFDPPARTTWVPEGCRSVPAEADALASRVAWRNLHSDEVNTDEVASALAPVFRTDWTAESATWNPTGPVFDSAGNLYFVPFVPYENVALISLDANDGSRRFSVPNTTGAPVGAATPLVLDDPDDPGEQTVVVALYDRAFAVRTDGTVLWDVPTGLPSVDPQIVFGVNYLPEADAVAALTRDGFVYALDRRTGAPILSAPFQLPGEVSPPGPPSPLPPAALICLAQTFAQFVDVSQIGFGDLGDILLGNNTEVANHFSVDANTSRLWIAATAPDAEDGTVDGVSELGALYRLDLVPNAGGSFDLVERCHASFAGGSASTPALPTDGSRIYVGDNFGKLIAVEPSDCSEAWSLDVGAQIFGSIGVASDNRELYAATAQGVASVIDEGGMGRLRWFADIDAFDFAVPGLVNLNLNLVSIGANAIQVQIGAGFPPNLPLVTGIGQVDRDTGALRYFTVGTEETVAVMSTGPDGAVYIGNSPFRRINANCLAQIGVLPIGGPPVVGGITRYAVERHDLLIRDAVCAGEDRARNAFDVRGICPDSAHADAEQIGQLVDQARRAAPAATQSGDLTAEEWAAVEKELQKVDKKLATGKLQHLNPATQALRRACHELGG